ncbi:lytic transglycosylase domain-containing protein [Xanthomonas translucens pv. translucens]|uniref:lytic transglycosylase domain-containing protein n=1 Tax=Xanthomonas campestris pv. translucens TaxID=343 RepID=UPI0021BAD8CF|nr:lytic transglycosylase domain-containing protein [Xanthomonas translucens]MCT8308731.1 lytic transglycosylase domain-containing protein [Xanthomonas translucens pv. translucens]
MANIKACFIVAAALTVPAGSVQASGQAPVLSGSVLALARQCATDVHPLTMGYLVAAESSNNRLAIGVNGNYRLPRQPVTHEEAVATIRWLAERNYNFDVGWGQVNSQNFALLGVTGEGLLDGCTNLRASAKVLTDCYKTAVKDAGEGQGALQRALSCYNTGSQTRGFRNGYVGRLLATAKQLHVPALEGAPPAQGAVEASNASAASTKDQPSKTTEGTPDAFAQEAGGAFADSSPGALRPQPPPVTQETQDAGVSNSSTPAGGSIP